MRAFTLLELLVAMMLIGLATGLVITQAHHLVPGIDRTRAAWQVADLFALCRRQAVADGDFYNVAVDIDLGRLRISACADQNHDTAGAVFDLPGDLRVFEVRSAGNAVTTGTANIMITPTGIATPFALALGDSRPRLTVTSDGLAEEVVDLDQK